MRRVMILVMTVALVWPASLVAADATVPAARYLVMVRHGHHSTEPVSDPAKGPPLTPLGKDQARLAARRVQESLFPLDAVLASPMLRSQETAQAIVGELKAARLILLPDLTECTPPMPPEQSATLKNTEELKACADQFNRVFDAYVRPSEGAESGQVLVAHANVIRYLLTRAMGLDARAWQQFSLSHGSVTTLRIAANGTVTVLGVGDIGHVPRSQRSGSIIDADSSRRPR